MSSEDYEDLWKNLAGPARGRSQIPLAACASAVCVAMLMETGVMSMSEAGATACSGWSKRTMNTRTAIAALALIQPAHSVCSAGDALLLHSFNFSTGAQDGTGSADGTLIGGAEIIDGQLRTDGSSGYVQFGSNIIPTNESFSIALAYKTDRPNPSGWSELVSQGCYWCPGFSFGRGIEGVWRINPLNHPGIPGLPYELSSWHHVAITSDLGAGQTRLWIDGALRYSTDQAIVLADSGTLTRFAREYGVCEDGSCGDNEYFHDGSIDDVRIYRGVLGAEEISQLAQSALCNALHGPQACCAGDLNADGEINGADISVILAFWGPNPVFPAADTNHDGRVDGADLAAVLTNWGSCAH